MNMRIVIFSAALWATIAAPAFCVAEVMHHECAGHGESGTHEEDYDFDPCEQLRDFAFSRKASNISNELPGFLPIENLAAITQAIAAPVIDSLDRPPGGPLVYDSAFPLLS